MRAEDVRFRSKRGVGASDGDALRVGTADGHADARAGLGWLADRGRAGRSTRDRGGADGSGRRRRALRTVPGRRAVRRPVSPEALGIVTGWVGRHWGPAAAGVAS